MLLEKVGRLELEIWKSNPGFEPTGVDVDDRSDGKNSAILRTCLEIRETDPSLDSGMYWIDPDGQGVGDGAIYVFCDMTLGKSTTERWRKYKYLKNDVTVGTHRIDICSARQRITNKCGTLRRSWMLFQASQLQCIH